MDDLERDDGCKTTFSSGFSSLRSRHFLGQTFLLSGGSMHGRELENRSIEGRDERDMPHAEEDRKLDNGHSLNIEILTRRSETTIVIYSDL